MLKKSQKIYIYIYILKKKNQQKTDFVYYRIFKGKISKKTKAHYLGSVINIYMYICVCICIEMYIYIHTNTYYIPTYICIYVYNI